MGRTALVPRELINGPFTLEQARQAGIGRRHLAGRTWRRLAPEVYVLASLPDAPIVELTAAKLRMPSSAVFSGLTAAWLHGLDVNPSDPVEMTLPPGAGVSGRSGIRVRRTKLPTGHVVAVRGLSATSIERTLADLSAALTVTETVALADAATHARLTDVSKLEAMAEAVASRPGTSVFRQAVQLVEPATESMMESRLRLLLVLSGLPRPQVQRSLHDRWGRFLGRPDLFYPDSKLGIEYDGGTHRSTLVDDNRRQNRLLQAGFRLLRFTAGDVYNRPEAVVAEVAALLRSN